MSSEIVAVNVTTHRQPILIATYYGKGYIKEMKLLTSDMKTLLLQYKKKSPFWIGSAFNIPEIDRESSVVELWSFWGSWKKFKKFPDKR